MVTIEQLNSEVDTILCPIGGGGIIAGVAVAAKALNPNVKVIGVQTSNIYYYAERNEII